MSRCLCLGGSQDLEGLSSLCSTCAHSGQENRKHTLENFSKILKHWRVYRASLPNGMQIAHARAYKELKWSLITYVQVLTFHPLFYSFLEVNTSFDVDWPTLASASTQLRKRFRSGRRSWWSPSARQRSSAQTFGKNRLKLGFHVLVFLHSFDLCIHSSWSSCTSFWSELRRCKPVDVDKPFSCQQKNSLALSVDVSQFVSRLATRFGCWDDRACLLLNTLSFMFTPKIISLKSWTGSKHM